VARRIRHRLISLIEGRENKDAVRALFDRPELMGYVAAGLWAMINARVERGIETGAFDEPCHCLAEKGADPDCRRCGGKGYAVDEETVIRIYQAQLREARGLVALGLASQSVQAGGTINITIPITSGPAEDPGDGDLIEVS
jgi:hypothetical protein